VQMKRGSSLVQIRRLELSFRMTKFLAPCNHPNF
jgi:hypothetical protein